MVCQRLAMIISPSGTHADSIPSVMCGRFTHLFTWKQLHRLLSLTSAEVLLDRSYNLAPSQHAPIVRESQQGRGVEMAEWGFRPAWSSGTLAPINARAETAATSPMFRGAFASRRCIVPISGFYEWQQTQRPKQPWYITRADGEIMLLAGLFETREDGTTFAILTTPPNAFIATIHDRMPAVLEPESASRWLAEPEASLLRPAADGVLIARPVSSRVNSPKHNDAALIEPVDMSPPPSLF